MIIPTSRGGSDLDACLGSLEEQQYPRLEVIVVDNASPVSLDYLPERFRSVKLIRNDENLGFVGACNQGIEMAQGEFVLFLNDDTEVEPGALRALVDALVARKSWAACQAKLVRMDEPDLLDTAGSFLTSTGFLVHRGAFEPEENFTRSDEVFAAKGAALLVRSGALCEVGGFDPDFFAYFEETDLCWRLWLAGWEVGYAAEARIRHRLGSTASGLAAEFVQFHSFKNRICTLIKNLGTARLVWMLPTHLVLCLGLAGWFTVRGRVATGRGILRAIGWNARHLPKTAKKRAAIQRHRRLGDSELMPRITRPVEVRTLFGYARMTAGASASSAVESRKPG